MSDGSLSQDEIDALLQGTDDVSFDAGGDLGGDSDGVLSQNEKSSLTDLINSASSNVGAAIGAMVGKNINISNPRIEVVKVDDFQNQITDEIVEIKMDYEGAILGEHYYYLEPSLAQSLGGLMMGQEGGDLTDASLSAVSEAMNVISGNFSNTVGTKIGKDFKPSVPATEKKAKTALSMSAGTDYIKVQYDFTIEGNPPVSLYEVFALNIVKEMTGAAMPEANEAQSTSSAQQPGMMPNMGGMQQPGMMPNMGGMQQSGMMPNMGGMQQPGMMSNMGGMQQPGMMPNMGGMQQPGMMPNMGGMMPMNPVQVQGVQFSEFNDVNIDSQHGNINLLMDVNMELTVELGRTKKSIKDILGMGEGTVIELDKLAGEPVDVLVNGQLIAKGEVVVIDENFGVRVTEIINPLDRIRDLT